MAPHREHVLCAGADTRQADARRLRLLALDVFFLGTAIGQSWGCGKQRDGSTPVRPTNLLAGAQCIQHSPAGIPGALFGGGVDPVHGISIRGRSRAILGAQRGNG